MKKIYIVGLVVVLIIAISGLFFPKFQTSLGGSSSDNYNLVRFQGGIMGTSASFVSTTTVACMVQNPTNATSTWTVAFKTNVATTTTTVLGVSTSTNASRFATSTALTSLTIAANAVSSGSYNPASNNNIIGPGEWVLVGYGAGTTLPLVAQKQQGQCTVLFKGI
jgi:hypothetical protein